MDIARQRLERLTNIFGPRSVYVELQRHFRPDQEARTQVLVELAARLKLRVVATNGVAYAAPKRRELQDIFTCTKHKTTISEAGRLLNVNHELYLKSSQEMSQLFTDFPNAVAETPFL